jgi:hypothetical protein
MQIKGEHGGHAFVTFGSDRLLALPPNLQKTTQNLRAKSARQVLLQFLVRFLIHRTNLSVNISRTPCRAVDFPQVPSRLLHIPSMV